VKLRGFEPLQFPAEIAAELRWMFFGGVTRVFRVLRICVGVLRDVTVLAASPRSLSYELPLWGFRSDVRSHMRCSEQVEGRGCCAGLHRFGLVSRSLVPKSVPKSGRFGGAHAHANQARAGEGLFEVLSPLAFDRVPSRSEVRRPI
jgi:hypothetical protein